LKQLLGLAEDATDEQVTQAVQALLDTLASLRSEAGAPATATAAEISAKIRAKGVDLSQYVAASEYSRVTAELTTVRAAQAEREITEALAEGGRSGKIAPASQPYWKKVCADARSASPLLEYLKVAVPVVAPGAVVPGTPPAADAALTAEEKAICSQLGLTEEQFKTARGA
jgi:phage I-like protein